MGLEVQTLEGVALTFGPFWLFPLQRIVLRAGTPLRLGNRAREILVALVERAGEVVSKRELIARVWPDSIVEEGTLRVHVAALRKALGGGEAGRRYVQNITGQGYRFAVPVMHIEDARAAGISCVAGDSGP
jgi:DNA-binding winged helix-turn-helix (wHTH) protein